MISIPFEMRGCGQIPHLFTTIQAELPVYLCMEVCRRMTCLLAEIYQMLPDLRLAGTFQAGLPKYYREEQVELCRFQCAFY